MSYGHAERNLAMLRQLEAETRELLASLDQLDPERSAWLQEVTSSADDPLKQVSPGSLDVSRLGLTAETGIANLRHRSRQTL